MHFQGWVSGHRTSTVRRGVCCMWCCVNRVVGVVQCLAVCTPLLAFIYWVDFIGIYASCCSDQVLWSWGCHKLSTVQSWIGDGSCGWGKRSSQTAHSLVSQMTACFLAFEGKNNSKRHRVVEIIGSRENSSMSMSQLTNRSWFQIACYTRPRCFATFSSVIIPGSASGADIMSHDNQRAWSMNYFSWLVLWLPFILYDWNTAKWAWPPIETSVAPMCWDKWVLV